MKLLSLETSTENCSVALLNDDVVTYQSKLAPQKHAEMIIPMIDELLTKANLSKNDLDGIALSVGPGSFTGVRIAASTAQGLALALNKKVACVTSLMALAYEAYTNDKTAEYVISSIDARMGEVYLAVYKVENNNLNLIQSERVIKPEEAFAFIKSLNILDSKVVCSGSGIEILRKAGLDEKYAKLSSFPQAQFILDIAKDCFLKGDTVDAFEALPLYVRNEVTWKKVNEQ